MKNSWNRRIGVGIRVAILSLLALAPASPGSAEPGADDAGGGIIIIRNCPKNEINNFSYMPSSVAGGGWAEISSGDQRFRFEFDSFSENDLDEFNRLGNGIEPRITVMVYYGDFIFFVRSQTESYDADPEVEKRPINLISASPLTI